MTTPTPDKPDAPGYGFETAKTAPGEVLPWDQVVEWLTASRNYWVCSTRPDGRPHAMPVWGLWFENAVYFSTGRASQKGRNLAANPEVVIHLESGDKAVILEGRVSEVTDRELLDRFAQAYEKKYAFRPNVEDTSDGAYYVLDPRKAFAWREQDFPESAARWRFDT
jgi:general stress protein 26